MRIQHWRKAIPIDDDPEDGDRNYDDGLHRYLIMLVPDGMHILINGKTYTGSRLYLYSDGTFEILLPDGLMITGYYRYINKVLYLFLNDGTVVSPVIDKNGNYVYTFKAPDGSTVSFTVTVEMLLRSKVSVTV